MSSAPQQIAAAAVVLRHHERAPAPKKEELPPSSVSQLQRLPRGWMIAAFAALLVLTVAVYVRGLHGEFTYDDAHTIEQNHDIQHPDRFLTVSALRDLVLGKRVLTDFTFSLNYAIGHSDPWPYHATNLAIHLVAICLVFAFTRKVVALSGLPHRDLRLLAVTSVFALHPLQTQAVIYVSQRAESMASVLYLGALLLLLNAERKGPRAAGIASYAGALALFVMGLGAKIILFTMPFAYLLIGVLPPRSAAGAVAGPDRGETLLPLPKRLALAAPFALYGVLTVVLAVTGMKGPDAGFNVPSLPPWRYFLTQWRVVVTYLRLLFWPAGQNVDWDVPLADGLADPIVIACGLGLGLLLGLTVYYLRRRGANVQDGAWIRAIGFGVLWFFLLLCPTSTFVPLADVLMEHRTYLASWGIVFAAFVVTELVAHRLRLRFRPQPAAERRGIALTVVLGLILCATLAGLTWARTGLWRTKLLLWTDAVAKSPHKARPHLGVANVHRMLGELPAAIPEYRVALSLSDREPQWIRSQIREFLALSLVEIGRVEEALEQANAGLTEDHESSGLYGVLAAARLSRGQVAEAEAAAIEAVRTSNANGAALRVLGMALNLRGEHQKALNSFKAAIEADPDDLQAQILVAWVYQTEGKTAEACEIARAVRDAPPDVERRKRKILADCATREP